MRLTLLRKVVGSRLFNGGGGWQSLKSWVAYRLLLLLANGGALFVCTLPA
jgi:hypothetical protein